MNKFILKPYKTIQFYVIILALFFQLKFFIGLFTLKNVKISWGIYIILAFFALQFILWACCVSIEVIVDDNYVVIKRPLLTMKIKRSDIKSVKHKYVGAPGYVYYIYTDKKKYWLPDNLENMPQLLRILGRSS